MSTFSKGDKVRVIDVDGQDPQRALVLSLGEIHTVEEVTRHGWPRFGGYDWLPERFEKVEHAEPEDATDAYVEPEPLKEGDWLLVWARVDNAEPDEDGEILLYTGRPPSNGALYAAPDSDAIVRPDAGQVPPWLKPAQCTSLLATGRTTLHRCEGEAGHQKKHVVGWVAWTDAEAYGRVEVSS